MRAGFATSKVAEMAALWRVVADIPVPKRAYFAPPKAGSAVVQFETLDVDAAKRPLVERTVVLPHGGGHPTLLPGGSAVFDDGHRPVFYSPSRELVLRFYTTGENEWVSEVRRALDGAIVCRAACGQVHGPPMALDGTFQSVSWSADENLVVFVAERHRPKAPELWKAVSAGDRVDADRTTREYRETWGETIPDVCTTTLVLLDVGARKVSNLLRADFLDVYSAGNPVISRNGERVTFLGFSHIPQRLGVAYCSSRKSKLFSLDVKDIDRTPHDRTFSGSIRSLCRSPATDDIAATVPAEGCAAHAVASSLVLLPAAEVLLQAAAGAAAAPMKPVVLVDVVDFPDGPDGFPGLYPTSNGDVLWADAEHVLVNSCRRNQQVIYVAAIGKPHQVPRVAAVDAAEFADVGVAVGTVTILDASERRVLASVASTTRVPRLIYTSDVTQARVQWTTVWDAVQAMPTGPIRELLTKRWSSGAVRPPADEAKAMHDTQGLLHAWKDAANAHAVNRTAVFVHGGPHSCDTSSFSRQHLLFLLAGFNILSINYGGSLGFGQGRIAELGGHAGTSDVQDCIAMVKYAQRAGLLPHDRNHLVVTGGSHGGFLSAHLTGQAPSLFCATAMRNPVTNIASMMHETDIPDWCEFETGLDPARQPDLARDVQAAAKASPMRYVQHVTTPTLVAIGRGDLRVPPPQGYMWYRAVSKQHVESRLLEYPGVGHALDTPAAESEFAILATLFFNKHSAPTVVE